MTINIKTNFKFFLKTYETKDIYSLQNGNILFIHWKIHSNV